MSQHYQGVGGASGVMVGRAFRYLPTASTSATTEAPEDADEAMQRFAVAQQESAAMFATSPTGCAAKATPPKQVSLRRRQCW
ncbi:MAG: hypothetical protein HC893_13580 [Chloroflexaceae bacterium]|nr:hypothetical protein [Chloroflexaceae bacterium]